MDPKHFLKNKHEKEKGYYNFTWAFRLNCICLGNFLEVLRSQHSHDTFTKILDEQFLLVLI